MIETAKTMDFFDNANSTSSDLMAAGTLGTVLGRGFTFWNIFGVPGYEQVFSAVRHSSLVPLAPLCSATTD
jgi:hypothetical protein